MSASSRATARLWSGSKTGMSSTSTPPRRRSGNRVQTAGVNTLAPEFTLAEDGSYASFAVKQTASAPVERFTGPNGTP